MDVQQFERLLMRYERLAGKVPRLQWLEKECLNLRSALGHAQSGNNRRDRDMQAAEAKIEEWAAYATKLRSMITLNRKNREGWPAPPKPLETEMPF